MTFPKTFALAALAAGLSATAALASPPPPTGVWIDHTGRGAVEIVDCGGALCGHVVWVKDAKNTSACRTQIIGNARPVGTNTWDRGWILDPDDNSKYSVELKTIGQDRLRVVGYMGTKLFSETFTWKRAPADLKRCDGRESVLPVAAPPAAPPVATPDVSPSPTPDIAPPTVAPPATVLQREASAARVPPPEVVTRTQPEDAAPEPRAERRAKRKPASRQCSLDLPYITLKYPCDAF